MAVNSVNGVLIPDAASVSGKENTVETAPGLTNRLLKNAHLRRCPHPSSLRRTSKYASLLSISGALHLGIFEQSEKNDFFNRLLIPLVERWPSLLCTI
jgi:hypothetical protein